jgi:hypothetical protein
MAYGSVVGGRGTPQAIRALVGSSEADLRLMHRAEREVLDAGASALATCRHVTCGLCLPLSPQPQIA